MSPRSTVEQQTTLLQKRTTTATPMSINLQAVPEDEKAPVEIYEKKPTQQIESDKA